MAGKRGNPALRKGGPSLNPNGRAKTQVRKVAQKLRKASKAHAGQAKTLSKLVKNGTNKKKKKSKYS